MKNLSVRLKITLWFSAVLVVVVALTFAVILAASRSVLQKTIRDNLIGTIEDNVDEVEYFDQTDGDETDNDEDIYIRYASGYLEIDDDFLDQVNDVYTALYNEDGTLLYGENPLAKDTAGIPFSDFNIQNVRTNSINYYIYDRALSRDGLDGLWLRGIVSEQQGTNQMSDIVSISFILLPALLITSILGGYIIAGKMLKPVQKIESAAKEIGQGHDLKRRIGLGPGKDELHQLAKTFDEMFERLDASFETERQFISNASHELRTPMSVIMAQCEYSLEKARSAAEYEEAIGVISRQSRKMSRMIADMLEFTRLEQKAVSIYMEPVDLSELVSLACEDMALLREKGIELTYEVERGVRVHGNRDLLSRLFTNLISNSYRYGREDGRIKVCLWVEDRAVKLSVADDGIGISPDQQEKIFNRFYQVDSSHSNEGTRLGLSMVKEIARVHGGEVSVESELGKGSVFTLTLKNI